MEIPPRSCIRVLLTLRGLVKGEIFYVQFELHHAISTLIGPWRPRVTVSLHIIQALRVDSSGRFLFVSNRVTHGDMHGSISVFRLDPDTGLPSGQPTVSSTLGH